MKESNTMLVVIDAKEGSYKRYSGKTCVLKVTSPAGPLDADQVEKLRTNPKYFDIDTAPEAA